jgi:hypothetical protein
MASEAVQHAESFFASIAQSRMSEPEAALYRLKIDREALVRRGNEYHHARLHIQCTIKPGAAQDKALAKLNAIYPMGYCKTELVTINAAIAKATIELHHYLRQAEAR